VLVAGGAGLIGGALVRQLRAEGDEVVETRRGPGPPGSLVLDLAAPSSTWPRLDRFEVAFLCAGRTALADCENDPPGTRRVNVDGTVALARLLHDGGSRVVLVSSPLVFDGTLPIPGPSDTPSPVSEYGRQKADAERAVLALLRGSVLRLAKVIGPGAPRLVEWRESLLRGGSVGAFDDLRLAPLPLAIAVEALVAVGRCGQPGIHQLSGPREETYYSMARATAEYIGVDPGRVHRASAEAAGVPPAFRPRHVRLAQALPVAIEAPGLAAVVAAGLQTFSATRSRFSSDSGSSG
jgi:dTDP-4-dehydrorhamnose reductase